MKATKLSSLAIGVALLSAAAPTAARADVVTLTFEGIGLQTGTTSLVLTSGGLTATLTRPGGAFAITDLSFGVGDGVPVSWGTRTLDPFANTANLPFLLNFSQGITGLSIQMGDFGADDDVLLLQLFSGADATGTLLGTASIGLPGGGSAFSFQTPSVSSATPALSARFIGGSSSFPNSVFYDNITATFGATTATPEPATLALMASGLIGIGLIRRKKRS